MEENLHLYITQNYNKDIDNIFTINDGFKILHFVRHGQAHHNVAARLYGPKGYLFEELEDASLTNYGINQCLDLHDQVTKSNEISNSQLLAVSPMRRTIQTATYSFPQFINKIPWYGLECLREKSGLYPSDRRRPITEHVLSYPHINFTFINDIKDSLYYKSDGRESQESVLQRANEFLQFISKRQEKDIIVVSHSSYLYTMIQHVLNISNEQYKVKFHNCELRSFIIDFR